MGSIYDTPDSVNLLQRMSSVTQGRSQYSSGALRQLISAALGCGL